MLRMCWRNAAFCSHPALPPPPTIIPCCLSASRPVIARLHHSLYRNNWIAQGTRRDLVFEEVGVKYLLAIVGQEPLFASDHDCKLEIRTHSTTLNPSRCVFVFLCQSWYGTYGVTGAFRPASELGCSTNCWYSSFRISYAPSLHQQDQQNANAFKKRLRLHNGAGFM
jgi:hypothetical protein